MKISILAIGTELTEGQILNRNAAWLSQKFQKMGFSTQAHLTVPDDRSFILKSLQYLEPVSDILVITGGLGPTSDDFTRDLVAEWSGQKLEWRDEAWAHIQERLGSRGIAVRDIQKQQCYFPHTAKILPNSVGTAHGFALEKDKLQIFVLPGPPREIEDIWNRDLEPWFQEKSQTFEALVTKSWDCLGAGESQIAELTEEALRDAPCEIGYRVHLPYVEVKARFLKKDLKALQPYFQRLESALGDLLALQDGVDPGSLCAKWLINFDPIQLQDQVTDGQLLKRLLEAEPKLLAKDWSVQKTGFPAAVNPGAITLILENSADSLVRLTVHTQDFKKESVLLGHVHYLPASMSERRKQYFTEKALIALMEFIE
jgi:molybdenum cofactor synthesis domain-containing protein